jgi:hypothetical protein
MEAGGFEPPSRDISGRSSTCVVVDLRFAPQTARRRAVCFAIPLKNLVIETLRKTAPTIPLVVAGGRFAGETRRCGPRYLRSQFILVVAS